MRSAVTIALLCGCDRVFGLALVPDAPAPLPPDSPVANRCATLPPALLCADFDTPHSGLEQFVVDATGAGSVTTTQSEAISLPNAMDAVIPSGAGPAHARASFDLAVTSFQGAIDFDVKVMDLAVCQPTIVAVDFPGSSGGYEVGVYTTTTTFETYISGVMCPLASYSIALAPSAWHHVRLSLSVPDGNVGIDIDSKKGALQCNPGLAGTPDFPVLRFGGTVGTTHDGECITLIDNIVVTH